MASITAQPRASRPSATNGSVKPHASANGTHLQPAAFFEQAGQWQEFARALSKRRVTHTLAKRLGATGALAWGAADSQLTLDGAALARLRELTDLEQARPGRLFAATAALDLWLAQKTVDVSNVLAGLEALAWAHALPVLADSLEPAVWQAALEKLVRAADTASKSSTGKNLLARQLFAVELPRTLSYWFPEAEACKALAAPGGETATKLLEAVTDAEGVCHAQYLSWLRPLLASWTRVAAMETVSPRDERVISTHPRFPKLVGHALRLARADGSQALGPPASSERVSAAAFFRAALKNAGEPARRVAALTFPTALDARQRATGKANPARKNPAPAFNSELSQLAVLRTSWAPGAPRLTVAYDNKQIRTELTSSGELIWSGNWNPEITWNQTPLKPVSEWEEVCWFSDDDVDYLELEISLTGGVRIQRHVLLARQDQFLFTADAVLGEKPGAIGYRSVLPLAPSVRFAPAKESHEGMLTSKRANALVLPLALPEWRTAAACGAMIGTGDGLELQQSAAKARAMFAPRFIDLAPRRFSQPFTWRRLTVAENRQILPDDLAVGYRVQVGGQQWLFYRSLGDRGNRTLLGHNLVSEFLAARFNWDGIAESLIEIE